MLDMNPNNKKQQKQFIHNVCGVLFFVLFFLLGSCCSVCFCWVRVVLFVFVGAILSWCPKTWPYLHVHCWQHFSLNIFAIYIHIMNKTKIHKHVYLYWIRSESYTFNSSLTKPRARIHKTS